jgi:hemoglobin
VAHAHGAAAIRHAVDLFVDRMAADPLTREHFAGVELERLRAHQRAFLVRAIGGASAYSGRSMREAHAGLGIDDAAFDRCIELLEASMREAGVSADVVARAARECRALRGSIVEGSRAG